MTSDQTLPVLRKTPLPAINEGRCYIFFAFDLGLSIDLDACKRLINAPRENIRLSHKQKTPKYFDYNPPPLRIAQNASTFTFTDKDLVTADTVDVTIFDFGSVSMCYKIDLRGNLNTLIELSEVLYENEELYDDSLKRVEALYSVLLPAIHRPRRSNVSENYQVFDIASFDTPLSPTELRDQYGPQISQILRSDRELFSTEQIQDALACCVSYTAQDITFIDWNTAFLYGGDAIDVRAVLEFGNVELLEMRLQDNELDQGLESAYRSLSSGLKFGADQRRIAQMQVDSAMMYEGVNNALKLLGDQYLARVYSLVSRRFHLHEWDQSILRKLDTLNSIYTKIADQAAQRRTLLLELAIVLLFVFEIATSFFKH